MARSTAEEESRFQELISHVGASGLAALEMDHPSPVEMTSTTNMTMQPFEQTDSMAGSPPVLSARAADAEEATMGIDTKPGNESHAHEQHEQLLRKSSMEELAPELAERISQVPLTTSVHSSVACPPVTTVLLGS